MQAFEVDMKPLDANVLNYHHFMALFKDIVERHKSVTKAWILSAPFGHKSHYHIVIQS